MQPKVRIARPTNRPFQLRYTDRETGKEVRISCGSRDEADAKRQKAELEAKLLLGLPTSKPKASQTGPNMPWDEFREFYTSRHVVTTKPDSAVVTETRLDVATRIVKPKTLADMARADTLHDLQSRLLAGEQSQRKRPRSAHTVKSYMTTVLGILYWAELQGWLDKVPKVAKIKTSKLKAMKGRPINAEEFDRMLDNVEDVVGAESAASWKYLLRGLWASALRLEELLNVSWDLPNTITPEWRKRRLPVLRIPAAMQKNATEEEIPLLPWFEEVLQETPREIRTGWVFDPVRGRGPEHVRMNAKWVGRKIGAIGKAAGIVVDAADKRTGKPAKFASAHDLRRSCGQRLENAGVPRHIVTRIMRHSDEQTTKRYYLAGDVQNEAGTLRSLLVPRYTSDATEAVDENQSP